MPRGRDLTWFGTSEASAGGTGMASVLGHPTVRSLWLGGFRGRDLTSITAPSLVELHLGPASRLESLSGLEQHADRLAALDLHAVPALGSLAGLGALARLEVLGVGAARQVSTLEDVAAATSLRLLKIDELKGVESLAPLAGHRRLEFLTLGAVKDRDLGPLFELPRLALVAGPPRGWNSDIHDLPYAHDIPDDDPRQVEYARLVLRL